VVLSPLPMRRMTPWFGAGRVPSVAAMRIASQVTSLSWIPSEAVPGLVRTSFQVGVTHYDAPPPERLPDVEALRDSDGFRFANVLRAWVDFDGTRPVAVGQDGGTVMGATTVRLGPFRSTFPAVTLPELRPAPRLGDGCVTFTQTCGGRTALPLPRPVRRPPFVRLQSPLVWTTLELTLHHDGRSEVALTGASPFPRHWVYGVDGELALKAGVADWQSWLGQPSWVATPWGDEDSPVVVAAAESALERELSKLLMHGAHRPRMRRYAAGEVVMAQGQPGDTLLLLLDGMVEVGVDGRRLGELGPGAVLGERAVLEAAVRTATVTAVTPVRAAETPASAVDRAALDRLSRSHTRELVRPTGPR
jgi:hypothetical protein